MQREIDVVVANSATMIDPDVVDACLLLSSEKE
jgi:hypothetical protein